MQGAILDVRAKLCPGVPELLTELKRQGFCLLLLSQ
jgi:phosphoglycolate phosphatase-like HAD superfamily hydrolase